MAMLATLSLATGCVRVNTVSLTSVPAERDKPIEAQSSRMMFFGAAFDSDFIDEAIDELSEKCPQGKVEGVLTKFETIDYFLMIVAKQELNVRGYCR
jgi:hypothetical protein